MVCNQVIHPQMQLSLTVVAASIIYIEPSRTFYPHHFCGNRCILKTRKDNGETIRD